MSSNAEADANVTPRLKSAVLWGAVGALFFLVLHQAYLLLDGEFLGVGPVAAVAVGVFVATVLASYYTAGRLEVFEPDEVTVEDHETGTPEPETASDPEPATDPDPEPEPTDEPDAVASDDEGSADDDPTGDGDSAEDTSDHEEDEWIWGDQDG